MGQISPGKLAQQSLYHDDNTPIVNILVIFDALPPTMASIIIVT